MTRGRTTAWAWGGGRVVRGGLPALAPAVALTAALTAALGGGATPALAGGFELFTPGSKATGVAGAFVAQADDPSAVFHNVGGVALLDREKKVLAGVTLAQRNEGHYQGTPPGIGGGTAGSLETPLAVLPHAFVLKPLGENTTVGLGLTSPYRLAAEWSDPGGFAGRRISTRSEVDTYDLTPIFALRLSPRLGIGVGAVYRSSELSLGRRFAFPDPATGQLVDVASVAVTGDLEGGLGWTAGVLYRPLERLSFGFSYRSGIRIDYGGAARLTQIPTGDPQLDQLVAASLPLDADLAMSTGLDFPSHTAVGTAYRLNRATTLELDLTWTGWGELDEVAISIPDEPLLEQTIEQRLDDTFGYRFGVVLTSRTAKQLRAGIAFDPSPQPDETVGPFLPDADRLTVSVGVGLDWLDVGFQWTAQDERTVRTNLDQINGSYRGSSYLLSLSVGL